MAFPRIKPEPDFSRLEKVCARQAPDRVPLIELGIDGRILERVREASFSADPKERRREVTDAWLRLGYDFVIADITLPLPQRVLTAGEGERAYVDENRGMIETMEDFDHYPWPKPEDIDYRDLEFAAAALPEGMKVIAQPPGGVLEHMMWLMGYGPMSYALADQPDLIEAMSSRIGELLCAMWRAMSSHEAVGATWLGDDLGFKTQTMISPALLRRYIFPWHQRLAEISHYYGKPLLFHACGSVEAVMGDLIDNVQIDARHSFEDVIEPVTEAKRRWGDRIAILGGIDVDFLCRATPDQVRQRVREVLAACMPGGGYALGSGNSIPDYVPVENYLAMQEEGWLAGAYQ